METQEYVFISRDSQNSPYAVVSRRKDAMIISDMMLVQKFEEAKKERKKKKLDKSVNAP